MIIFTRILNSEGVLTQSSSFRRRRSQATLFKVSLPFNLYLFFSLNLFQSCLVIVFSVLCA